MGLNIHEKSQEHIVNPVFKRPLKQKTKNWFPRPIIA